MTLPVVTYADNPPGRKLAGWQDRLVAFLRANHQRPYEPGVWDCAIWAAGAVQAMTGEDHLRGYRGYRTIAEGKKRLQAKGYDDHVAYVAAWLPEINPAFAQPGDVAVIEDLSLGIVQGERVYLFGAHNRRKDRMAGGSGSDRYGFGTLPFTVISRAFRT